MRIPQPHGLPPILEKFLTAFQPKLRFKRSLVKFQAVNYFTYDSLSQMSCKIKHSGLS
jgi:hypothetical protein